MIWTAVFLLCSPFNCMTTGSPIFQTKDICERAAREYGLQAIAEANPTLKIIEYKCISFGDMET